MASILNMVSKGVSDKVRTATDEHRMGSPELHGRLPSSNLDSNFDGRNECIRLKYVRCEVWQEVRLSVSEQQPILCNMLV